MKYFIIILLAFLTLQSAHAQKAGRALIDSLNSELEKPISDTIRVQILSAICYEFRNINPRDALKPGLDGLQLAEKINYQYGKGLAHYSLTFIYHILSRLPESIDHALKAQLIFEKGHENNYLCATYLMLAYLYKDLDKGITAEYMHKATALLPDIPNVLWEARNYGTLGNNYRNLNQFDSAEKYMTKHLKMSEEFNLKGEMMVVKNRFGYLYMAESRLDTAFILIKAGLESFKLIGSTRMIAENSTTLGKIRLRQSKDAGSLRNQYLSEAEAYALEGLRVSCSLGYLIQRYTASKLLSDIYKAEGRNDMALDFLNAAFNDYDSVYGAQIVSKASVLSWRNEEVIKEKEVELLKLHNRQQLVIIFGAAFGIIILIIIVFVIINTRKKQKKAYDLVHQQKDEISRVLCELEATNQELEAFSYSVSHDLRAPVRRIEGLCGLISEDYEKLLDEKGKDLLSRITTSSMMMNRLIEDMLKLSRITSTAVTRTYCNLSEMASRICDDLKINFTGFSATCTIERNIMVDADERMLHIVLQSLLDNAFKYSSHADKPEIRVYSEIKDNRKMVCIADSGIGFDMTRAGKLFTPFQRLHSDEQFKGNGIGLAMVKRIVSKHGGTISALSEPGKGTIFRFTME